MLYIIGVGPGDEELLTLKAVRILKKTPFIFYPQVTKTNKNSLALKIVGKFVDSKKQKLISMPFVMRTKNQEQAKIFEKKINLLVKTLRNNQDVAFITLGDPSLYSTFTTLYEVLSKKYPEIKIEIIPGITSFSAAAARTFIPLGKKEECIAIIPAVYKPEKIRQILKDFDTVVLLKIDRVFSKIYKILKELNLEDKAVFIQNCGGKGEKIIRGISGLDKNKIGYFSLLIVKK